MNLTPLNLFRSVQKDRKQFAVIGLGRFGRAVCSALHDRGYEVLGIDKDAKRVDDILTDRLVSHSLQLDSTDPIALQEAGIYEFDTVIIAIGSFLQESILTTLNVKTGGVSQVIAKASSSIHGTLLTKIGADRVVYPEQEAGYTLVRSLTTPQILDRFDLDPEHSIVEIIIPQQFHGKTLGELKLRNRYGVNAIASIDRDKFEINLRPDSVLKQGKILVVIGANQDISKLPLHN
ncbi:MAG: TrkA family potassium uptake protein [Chamaesiphon sp. CSU_1_12]|nr:TrkA family potassium uptake protein [Chamaesiphon sp. CSU_1_12]